MVPRDEGASAQFSVLEEGLDLRLETVLELLPRLEVPYQVWLGVVLVKVVVEQGPVVGRLEVLTPHP